MLFEQIRMEQDFKDILWNMIIKSKILNQSRNLAVLGVDGFEKIASYEQYIHNGDVDNIEALAAAEYFQFYHKGLNRRTDDPMNSALNYGYAIIRSYIIKAMITTGFHCAPYVHDFIGSRMQSGTVRISLGIFNTMEEIDALVKALGEIL